MEGMAAPEGGRPEGLGLAGVPGQVAGVVGRVLGPAQPAGGDDQHQGGRPEPPAWCRSGRPVQCTWGRTRMAMTTKTTMKTKER